MNDTPGADAAPPIEPVRRVQRDGTEFVLLGTAHVSRASMAAVESMLAGEHFDAVAVELCRPRAEAMRNPDALRQMDLFSVLREGRAATVAAGLALGAWQRRLAQQFGIEPGAEMVAAMDGAADRRLPCWLVDRDVGLTLRRARAAVGFWERAKLSAGLLASLIDDSEIDEADIEQLKERDVLENAFTEFGKQSPPIYRTLIAERDAWMAARLREEAALTRPAKVLVVIGAGHLAGIARALESETAPPTELLAPLRAEPPPSRAGRWFGAFLLLFVIGGFVYGFSQGLDVGVEVLWIWVLTTGLGGALGALAAGSHPLSIAAAFVASPLTTLHPALASGMASGAVELWARKPRVADFECLRDDLGHWRGWWRNRVARVFLVFFLTSFGTAAGVWIAGARIFGALS
jgi:pheromone shutdown-related protein TraB